jgi:hypothetical protein
LADSTFFFSVLFFSVLFGAGFVFVTFLMGLFFAFVGVVCLRADFFGFIVFFAVFFLALIGEV